MAGAKDGETSVQTRGYAYIRSSTPNIESDKLCIGVENGLPLRLIAEAETPKHTVTEDFHDDGAAYHHQAPC